ncbi:MAG TPA: hypothetical protein PL032_08090 [Syntrophorhabdus sp.]|nr:hypothetical protein [Syntrophorhabdus sp.]HOH26925.1 hypothetical protein [Syntrophorhabdus sp.]
MKKINKVSDDRKLTDRLVPDPAHGRLLGLLATTYEMQPEFFETDFLPTLLGLGAWDDRNWTSRIALERNLADLEAATILMDAHPYDKRPRSLRVEVIPVPLDNGSKLHAKVLLCVYEEAVKLIVASANLTDPGYRRNREVAAVLTASAKNPVMAQLILNAVRDMGDILGQWTTPSARSVQNLALERLSEWKTDQAAGDQWFVWSGGKKPLWQQFLDHWPNEEEVKHITIVSPFWSEEDKVGPIATFITALKKNGNLAKNAELRLLTDAAPDKQVTYKPKLPETFSDFDARSLGIDAKALAVDPRVPPEEVGMGKDFTGTRLLHAKVVLLEGENTSLAYIGSANFTRRGWGILPEPLRANIEAGLIIRRSGAARSTLKRLIPDTIGDAVPLSGAATGRLALPYPSPEGHPWPTFLREVVLVPVKNDNDRLELFVKTTSNISGPWLIAHLPLEDSPKKVLLQGKLPVDGTDSYEVSLDEESVRRLLREQEVQVEWWQCPEGCSFPINVDASARVMLPMSPGAGRPEEHNLIAYYQGRITWEDLFPDPETTPPTPGGKTPGDDTSSVDTSRIQSYIVRDFVEALKGIRDDLRAAAQSPKACMRLALLGSVSPVALARRIFDSAEGQKRSPMASAFQLVEILACLDEARHYEASPRFQTEWLLLLDEASRLILERLDILQKRYPSVLSQNFLTYSHSVRQHYSGALMES